MSHDLAAGCEHAMTSKLKYLRASREPVHSCARPHPGLRHLRTVAAPSSERNGRSTGLLRTPTGNDSSSSNNKALRIVLTSLTHQTAPIRMHYEPLHELNAGNKS